MKTKGKRIRLISALLCVLLAAMFCMPAQALREYDFEDAMTKLQAFWLQPAYDGMNNGEAVYDHEFIEGVLYWSGPDISGGYGGGWSTPLVQVSGDSYTLGFNDYFQYGFQDTEEDGTVVGGIGLDYLAPDLYGPLDLSYTCLAGLGQPLPGQTHISSVNLDGCDLLSGLYFSGQEYCTEFTAVDCASLNKIELINGAFERIDVSPSGFEKDVRVRSFGSGTVGLRYNSPTGRSYLFAYPAEGEEFLCWYVNGERVDSNGTIAYTEGGTYVACFTGESGELGIRRGDIDCDGTLGFDDVAALYGDILGAGRSTPLALEDVNCDGVLSFTDVAELYSRIIG